MKFSYRLVREKTDYIAECVESEAAGEGKTARDAIESLRKLLEERMFRPDAVAPPSRPTRGEIELIPVDGCDEPTTPNGHDATT